VTHRHERTEPSLARLLALDEASTAPWDPEDAPAVLEHLLDTSLASALADAGAVPAAVGLPRRSELDASIREVLLSPRPDPERLLAVKELCKLADRCRPPLLPEAVTTAVYYLAIAVGIARCGRRLSSLDDAELREGLSWSREQAWIPAPFGAIVGEALRELDA